MRHRVVPSWVFVSLLLIGSLVLSSTSVSAANFPTVRATSSGTATLVVGSLNTYSFTLPTGHVEGDLLIITVAGIAGATEPSLTFEGSWHQLYNSWTSASRIMLSAWALDSGGMGPTGEFVASIANTYRYIVHDITVGTWNTANPPQVGTAATGTSTTPDPPAVTPTWGSADDLFIAAGIWVSTATRSACPASYASPVDVTGTSPGISACTRSLTGTTDNPGTFTISASTAWTTQTIAVQGAAASLPTATFTYTISGLTATFTSTVTGGQGTITYAWNFGDGATSTSANPSRTYASGASRYTVSLTITDSATPPRTYVAWGTVELNYPSLVAVATESPGANCASGGQKITLGLDNGDGAGTALDGTLQSGEVDTTVYVCNGAAGAAGSNGANGYNSLVSTSTASEPPGANCASGGTKVTVKSGLDNGDGGGTASNGVLEAGEVDQTTTYYSCTGATGATGSAGTNGHNSLIVTDATVGTNCNAFAGTGTRVRVGVDTNDDGTLQAGEVQYTSYICDGATGATGAAGVAGYNSLMLVEAEAQGANCAYPGGGLKVRTGLDNGDGGGTARDGTLQSGEVDAGPFYICNGATGAAGATGATGATGPAGTAGLDGYNSLVKITAESAGVNCAAAGQRIESGLDNGDGGGTARDGTLQAGEVDAGPVYACNGIVGFGLPGHSALVSTAAEPAGSNCPTGGVTILTGTDLNDNGILDPSEVTGTDYACNGAAGPTGVAGLNGADGASGGMWLFLLLLIIAPGILLGATPFLRKPRSP